MNTVEKKYPKGTTREQWEKYEIDKAKHDAYYENKRPKLIDFFNDENYNSAFQRWSMEKSLDAPNEPGYYRAAND